MTDLALLLLLVGFTARLARFVQRDHLTERLRETLYDRWPYDDKRAMVTATWNPELRRVDFSARMTMERPRVSVFGYWVWCKWCFGTWLSAAVVAVVAQLVSLPLPVLWWGAVATGVGILGTW